MKYHIHNGLLLRMLVLMIIVLAGCDSKEHKILKLAHGLDPSHPVHRAMEFMAERVKENSGGKLEVQIYPSEQLGSEQQCVELLQIGSLAITKVSAAILEGFTDNYKVLGLPYIFRSKEHSFRVLDGEIGQEFLNSTERFWIKGLCFYDAGSRSFYTLKKPIESPADLAGLKIRVMKSQTAMQLVSAMGGSPTPVSWGELYTALQSGVVDGAENNPPSFFTSRHYEVCKYYSINEHTMVPDVLIISTKVWNSLDGEEQKWLRDAIEESVEVERKYWAESEAEAIQKVLEAGVEINYPNKEPFEERVQQLYESYKSEPEIYSLIQRIRAVQ
jgi:tripartite ATP-independent transporter DctP family solute receptor